MMRALLQREWSLSQITEREGVGTLTSILSRGRCGRGGFAGRMPLLAFVLRTLLISLVAVGAAHAAGVTYTYDDLGRLHQVIDQDGNVATYNYDAVGNIVSIERGGPACPLGAPVISQITSSTCYAGQACSVTITGNRLLGVGVTSGNTQIVVSDCRTTCTQATCTLIPRASDVGPISLTVSNSFGSVQGNAQVAGPPSIDAPDGYGVWHFSAEAGQKLIITMTRIANQLDGSSTLNPSMELYDSAGELLASDDDSGSNIPPGPGQNAMIRLTLPATDVYFVITRGAGGTTGPYVLTITPADILLVAGLAPVPAQGGPAFSATVAYLNANADSDGDGISDADEVAAGTDPYDSTSRPTSSAFSPSVAYRRQ